MNEHNPYRTPIDSSGALPKGDAIAYHSTERCPKCGAAVTFLGVLKQPTPFRYRCGRCRSNYRVRTPGMTLLFVGICVASVIFAIVACIVFNLHGTRSILPLLLAAGLCWGILELATYRYILRYGRFEVR